jgi:predicted TIM-barrel fold metal-dependent hydrolase
MDSKLAEKLHNEIRQIEIIDTHEHLINREMLANLGFNLFQAIRLEYIRDDLISLGMDMEKLLETTSDTDVMLDILVPLLKQTRNTTYFKAFFQALHDLHGLEGDIFDITSLKAVSESISDTYARADWYDHVVSEKCKIKYMLRDMDYMFAEESFIRPVLRMDNFLMLRHRKLLREWVEYDPIFNLRVTEAEYRDRVKSLDDYLALLESDFQKAEDFGIVAVKVGIAYKRTLQFDKVSIEQANRAFKLSDEKTSWSDIKAFQDYILFQIIEKASRRNLPLQIHTGLFANGPNTLANSNPMNLNNLFLEFPETRFDIFHGSFPFTGELGSLALMFPNVYLDTCWLPLISYTSFKNALSEWLDYVPISKFLWGGDCACAEGVYGAVHMARKALSEVLAEKIQAGLLDEETALEIAGAILHDNASILYGL